MQGRLPEQNRQMREGDKPGHGVAVQGLEAPPAHLSPDEKAQYFLRIHMLHRQLELHERYMLHPRVLDVLEVHHRAGRAGVADDAVPQAPRQARPGLAPGPVLHPDPPGHALRGVDRH